MEVLIAVVVIGLTAAAVLGAFATTISASASQRSLAGADAFLRSFVEKATYDISLRSSPAPAFVPCPIGVPSAYSDIASSLSNSTYTVTIASVAPAESGTCSNAQALPQQITAQVTATGVSDSTVFVVSQPNPVVAPITMAVLKVTPDSGPAAGGTGVTITGVGFTGATAVDFGSTPATGVSVVNDGKITATSPAGTGQVDVTVVTPAGTSPTGPLDYFTYAPTVISVAPTTGPATGGTSVTITGTGFIGTTSVSFGGAASPNVTVNLSTSITAISPSGSPGPVDVTVTTAYGTSVTSNADTFTYRISVTGVSPSSGPDTGGPPAVNLLGAGFTGATAVMFGSTPATTFTVNSDVSITAIAPPGTGTVHITVTGPTGTSATGPADQYTYTPGPPVGLGLVVKSGAGSGTPVAACGKGTGSNCSTPNNQSCFMTGTSTSTTCDISKIWGPGNNKNVPANAVFYIQTVDAAGNSVAYSATIDLNLTVTSATPNPITIPANGMSTFPNAVTATLTSKANTTDVTITGGGWTLNVDVSG